MFRNVLLSAVVLVSLVFVPAPSGVEAAEPVLGQQSIDSDAVTDRVGLVDPSTGVWFIRGQGGAVASFFYGDPGDVPFVGDWDCDGIDTPGLYRQSDGFAYLRNSNSQGVADIRFFFGNPGDFPLAGDFDGDGCDTLSIYRASEARIYVINELGANDGGLGAAEFSYIFGNPGDKPFVGDFNGDGVDTLGLHRESTGFVYFRQTHTQGVADSEFFYGDPGDRFVSGDWGIVDNIDTPAIFRPSNSTFYFRYSNTQGVAEETLGWGVSSFLPIAGNWGAVTAGGPVPDPGGPGPGGPGGPGTPLPLSLSGALPDAVAQVAYSAQLTIQGGTQPYSVQKVSGPAWINLTNTGGVSGVPPTGTAGIFTLEVRVTDTAGAQVTKAFPITVAAQCQVLNTVPLAQCQALAQLYNSTGGNAWTERTGWFTDPNPCTWHGLACVGANISQISLQDHNLSGVLPTAPAPNFGAFVGLQILDLDSNLLTGNIPIELGTLPAIQQLDLSENTFNGLIPDGVWTRTTLTHLDLSDNNLTGSIPATAGGLNSLIQLDVADNAMGPDIAIELWDSPVLQILDLGGNVFTGTLPAAFVLPAIVDFDLGENGLNGQIPDGIGGLGTGLTHLDLHDNNFGGAALADAASMVPDTITTLTGLAPVQGSLELRGNACLTASAGTAAFLAARDTAWNNGVCTP